MPLVFSHQGQKGPHNRLYTCGLESAESERSIHRKKNQLFSDRGPFVLPIKKCYTAILGLFPHPILKWNF